jgi:hypothetical protein
MGGGTDSVSAAMRLLKAVAGELRDLARDTARFGETLTGHGKLLPDDGSIRLLQKFDLFAQSLQAHAVLIDDISERLHNGTVNEQQIEDLLHHVPFFSVRERLRAVVNGDAACPSATIAQEGESDDFWFLNE